MLAAVFVCLLFLEWDENKQDITRSDALRLKQAVTFLFFFVFFFIILFLMCFIWTIIHSISTE